MLRACIILLLPLLIAADHKVDPLADDQQITSLQNGLVFDAPLTSDYTQSSNAPSDRSANDYHLDNYAGDPTISSTGTNFDGSDYVYRDVPYFLGAYTTGVVSFWMKTTSAGLASIITSCDTATANTNIGVYHSAGDVFYGITGIGSQTFVATNPVNDGQWHHVALYDIAGDGTYVYVDGAVTADSPKTSLGFFFRISGRDNVVIGSRLCIGSNLFYNGDLAFLKIHTRELTADELAAEIETGRRVLAVKVQ